MQKIYLNQLRRWIFWPTTISSKSNATLTTALTGSRETFALLIKFKLVPLIVVKIWKWEVLKSLLLLLVLIKLNVFLSALIKTSLNKLFKQKTSQNFWFVFCLFYLGYEFILDLIKIKTPSISKKILTTCEGDKFKVLINTPLSSPLKFSTMNRKIL